jgi:phosphoribosylformimino-5-aminoimidazole carboxamide ribotide isomerase
VGTKALIDAEFLAQCVATFPGRIIIGVDARDGVVALKGWKEESGVSVSDILPRLEAAGCEEIIYTDIARDGMLTGPNFDALRDVTTRTNMRVIASGGVARMEDFQCLLDLGAANLTGAITGKAIYEETLDLADAVRQYQSEET